MTIRRWLTAAVALGVLGLVQPAEAGVYKCVGPDGGVVYSDKACPQEGEQAQLSPSVGGDDQGPGPQTCGELREFGLAVARLMRRGIDSINVMGYLGGTEVMEDVAQEVVNFVYSFKSVSSYTPARVGGYVFTRCMRGEFSFPEATRAAAKGVIGSGVLVNEDGYVLTNQHVVDACDGIRVLTAAGEYPARVVAQDASLDLAVVSAAVPDPAYARFRAGNPPALGERVVVAGYPLQGLLADGLQVTTGTVSALAGIRNDHRHLQMTAPVQPGNSGGALLDGEGRLIGIVVSKLNAVKVAEITGDIPQNINFAVQGELARGFLARAGVRKYDAGADGGQATREIAAAARRFTVAIACR